MKSGLAKFRGPAGGAKGLRFAVVASSFHEEIVDGLLHGALREFERRGADARGCEVLRVPGAFELVSAAAQACRMERYDAVVCLGAVVRGETPHFDCICRAVSHGLAALCARSKTPVTFGVLTTDTLAQARARSGEKDNKGAEAASAAVEMALLFRRWGAVPGTLGFSSGRGRAR
jgi:6,7-dimethyl-8-ribityllumazine synthase